MDLYYIIGLRKEALRTRMVYTPFNIGLITGTYYFDQFDVKIDLPKYTTDEYDLFLKGSTSISILLIQTTIGQRRKQIIYGHYVLVSIYGGL